MNSLQSLNEKLYFEERSLNWLCSNIDVFRDWLNQDCEAKFDLGHKFKILGELGVMCLLYRGNRNYSSPKIEKLEKMVTEFLLNDVYLEEIVRHPKRSLHTASMAYFAFIERDRLNQNKILNLIRLGVEGIRDSWSSLSVYQQIELKYIINKIGIHNTFPKIDALYDNTILHKSPSLISVDISDIYTLTHLIFYYTDFGYLNRKFPKNDLSLTKSVIQLLLGTYTHEKNWDILAELLMCCGCLNFYPFDIYSSAWSGLTSDQSINGSVPGPTFSIDELGSLENKSKSLYCLKKNYHSTIVSVMACLLTSNTPVEVNFIPKFKSKNSLFRIKGVVDRSFTWLQRFELKGLSAQSLMYLILAQWICIIVSNTNGLKLSSFVFDAGRRIDKLLEQTDNMNSFDPALAFMTVGILRKFGVRSEILEEYAIRISRIIENYSNKSKGYDLFLSKYLLHRLHLSPDPVFEGRGSELRLKIRKLFADKNLMHDVTSYTIGLTFFGKKKLPFDGITNSIHNSLYSLLLHSVWNYNIDLGLRIIRLLKYLNVTRTGLFRDAVLWIIKQQHEDGRFGYLAKEINKIKEKNHQFRELESLYLPVTVSALWALSEICITDFVLCDNI